MRPPTLQEPAGWSGVLRATSWEPRALTERALERSLLLCTVRSGARPKSPISPPCCFQEGPDPLWKQALRQVVGLAFNGAQFYLLQYLPAKRADRKAERLQPRGPLF